MPGVDSLGFAFPISARSSASPGSVSGRAEPSTMLRTSSMTALRWRWRWVSRSASGGSSNRPNGAGSRAASRSVALSISSTYARHANVRSLGTP
jgi:hypothetical protein